MFGFTTTLLEIIVGMLVITLVYVTIRTIIFQMSLGAVQKIEGLPVDEQQIAEHLAAAIRCQTVPLDETGTPDPQAFQQLHQMLESTYPLVHQKLKREVVNGYSLLYVWQGTRQDLPPVMLMAHQDVVSADPADWTHPPFEGKITDGFIWGRGTLDIKNQLIGIMEAAEHLLKQGFCPERTIHFAFGHDEETGGANGAAVLGKLLKDRGIHLAAIVDEGGGIMEGIIPFIKKPVALIGNGEKGYLTMKYYVRSKPGHSSAPPRETSISILVKGLSRLASHRVPSRIRSAKILYTSVGPATPFWLRVAWANVWLFGGLLKRMMDKEDETRAYIRTTGVLTIFNAGTEDNTIPEEATAYVNYRLLPGYKIEDIVNHSRKLIDDERVEFNPVEGKANEVVGPSPTTGPVYEGLGLAIRKIYGDYPAAPFVMLGGTDCGHYVEVCDNIYRFTPLIMDPSYAGLEHGVDERIPISEMVKTVKFYAKLMQIWGTEKMAG
jgi:carboxypeptidase PM20D1